LISFRGLRKKVIRAHGASGGADDSSHLQRSRMPLAVKPMPNRLRAYPKRSGKSRFINFRSGKIGGKFHGAKNGTGCYKSQEQNVLINLS
jgi:hypothetical protein